MRSLGIVLALASALAVVSASPAAPPKPFKAAIVKLSVSSGTPRYLTLSIFTNRPAKANVKLLFKDTSVASQRYKLPLGRTSITLTPPQKLKTGWYTLDARFKNQGKVVEVKRPVHVK